MKINEIGDNDNEPPIKPIDSTNVVSGPWSKPKKIPIRSAEKRKNLSLIQAFGNNDLEKIYDAGFRMVEKPSYFTDLYDYKTIPRNALGKLQHEMGHKLHTFEAGDVLHINTKRLGPLADLNYKIEELPQTFILMFKHDLMQKIDAFNYETSYKQWNNIEYFLCNTTGAKSYIRFWSRLV